jgi:hypothetical protein
MCDTQRTCWGRMQRKGAMEGEWVLEESEKMSQKLHLIGGCWETASAISPHTYYQVIM